ncbi:hypothetical protein [Pedobacter sp.]|uniref:hypothetical protein n=1 Tax=Pedobacter sp. TaxID=1411316 RepID=UPI0031D7F4E3
MIAKIHSGTATYYKAKEKRAVKSSTYRERVKADRIVMILMLLGTIAFAVFTT